MSHIDIQEGRGATLDSLPAFILNFLIDFFKIICYNIFVGAGFPVGCLCAVLCLCGASHRYSGEGELEIILPPAFILNFLIEFFLEKQAELGFHS